MSRRTVATLMSSSSEISLMLAGVVPYRGVRVGGAKRTSS